MQLDRAVIGPIAEKYGLPTSMVLALVEVESAGTVFWDATFMGHTSKFPVIRFEGHYFYKRLSGANLKKAVAQGLASKVVGGVKNPKSGQGRYDLLARAMAIDTNAALESISMGVGQVMGAHWQKLGYKSAFDMFKVAVSGIGGQVELMCKFIMLSPAAAEAVRQGKYAQIAAFYNGSGYAKNQYDVKIEAAYKRYVGVGTEQPNVTHAMDSWDASIRALGFSDTKSFQAERNLVPDGDVGPATIAEVKAVQAERAVITAAPAIATGKAVGKGAGISLAVATGAAVQAGATKDMIQPVADMMSGWGQWGMIAGIVLVVGAVAVAAGYYIITASKTDA